MGVLGISHRPPAPSDRPLRLILFLTLGTTVLEGGGCSTVILYPLFFGHRLGRLLGLTFLTSPPHHRLFLLVLFSLRFSRSLLSPGPQVHSQDVLALIGAPLKALAPYRFDSRGPGPSTLPPVLHRCFRGGKRGEGGVGGRRKKAGGRSRGGR